MIEINGKYAKDVKIFTDDIEDGALSLIYDIANSPMFDGAHIRIMPDVHLGKGITIGFTCPLGEFVNPDHVGCDIGCTISADFFDKPIEEKDYPLFEHRIKMAIPFGMNYQEKTMFEEKDFVKFANSAIQKAYQRAKDYINYVQFKNMDELDKWAEKFGMSSTIFYKSIGTIGGGNHFVEYDECDGKYAFVVHTGSRNLGQKVWKYWNKVADRTKISKDGIRKITEETKANFNGDKNELGDAIKKAVEEYRKALHPGYLSGDEMKGYLTDMVICQAYAAYNHKIVHEIAAKVYNGINGGHVVDSIVSSHNYIDFNGDVPIVRKGSIRSYEGERMLIPFNMRDGVAVCEGKSNPDWNYSAPHGAGRKMSRSKAKEEISLDSFKESIKDVYSTTVCKNTIDEAPAAYKPMEEIIENIEPTCNVLFLMKPKINIKADDGEVSYSRK